MTKPVAIAGKCLSQLGFGCSSFWAKPAFPETRAKECLAVAADLGITYFDAGPSYADGEARLGRFLAARPRNNFIVSTKVGTLRDGSRSFEPDDMRRSLDGSLARLGLSAVDMLYLHGPSTANLTASALDHLLAEKELGRTSLVGINSFDMDIVQRSVDLPIDVVMLQYNVADQRFERLIEMLVESGKIVIAGTALAQSVFDLLGFLPRDRRSFWYLMRQAYRDPLFLWRGARLRRRLRLVDVNLHAAALRFVISHPLISSAVFNSTNPMHVRANVMAAARPLIAQQQELLRIGFTG